MKRFFAMDPVVIGGVGGSGTRLATAMVESLGFFMGDELNHARDNMRLARRFNEIQERVPGSPDGAADITDILEDFERDMYAAYLAQSTRRVGWGWKVPANFFILPQLSRHFGAVRYIHVIRHGLDMAFSSNQNQARNFGRHYGVNAAAKPVPEAGLAYWIRANTLALETVVRLGLDHLVINFDRLCADPYDSVGDLLRFLGREDIDLRRLVALIEPPVSLGRYRDHDLTFVTDADREVIRTLGFDVA